MSSQLHISIGGVVFNPPYFDELVHRPADTNSKGRLPRDIEAHALWYYYVLASKALKGERENLVYEGDKSKYFDVLAARRLLESVSFMYGSTPDRIVRYWEVVDVQRMALGFSSNADLPQVMRFRFN